MARLYFGSAASLSLDSLTLSPIRASSARRVCALTIRDSASIERPNGRSSPRMMSVSRARVSGETVAWIRGRERMAGGRGEAAESIGIASLCSTSRAEAIAADPERHLAPILAQLDPGPAEQPAGILAAAELQWTTPRFARGCSIGWTPAAPVARRTGPDALPPIVQA